MMRFSIFLILITSKALSQDFPIIGFGNFIKAGMGNTYVSVGIKPVKSIELYFAPAWSILSGGTSYLVGCKTTTRRRAKINPFVTLSFRHTTGYIFRKEISQNSQLSEYQIPSCDYLIGEIGISYYDFDKTEKENYLSFNISISYCSSTGKYQVLNLINPRQDIYDALQRRVESGLALNLLISFYKKKHKKNVSSSES